MLIFALREPVGGGEGEAPTARSALPRERGGEEASAPREKWVGPEKKFKKI